MQEKWKWPERSGSGETALRKGPWTKEEDEILVNFVKEKGIVKWTWIGKQTGLARSGKSCRLRWLNHLRPNLKKGSFTKEEEKLIVCLHSMHGNKWTRIASKLPGRTDNEIKNFWNTRLKKCQKKQLPIYPQSQTMEEDKSPVFHNDYLNKNDLDQIQTPLHHFSSTLPHSSHFSSHNQFTPTHQPLLQQPHSYLSSLHHSTPASYQSMQAFLSSHAMPPPTCLSSHPLIMPTTCASTPFVSSLDFAPFRHFKRPAGRLPRPLSAPLMSPSPTSQDPFHSSFQLNSSNHSSSLSPPNINKTQTSTVPTFQLNYSTAGPSNSSLQTIPLSVDITWPPLSPNSSFIFKAEPPSIQSHTIAARRHPSNASLRHLNTQSMISLDLLNAQLQEDLATRGCQSSRKQDFLDQNMTRENLLTECMETKDSSNNVTWKQSLSNEISKAKIPTDEYSKKDATWAESSKTMYSSGSSLNTEYSSYKSMRRKEFMNIGSHLTEGLLSEGSDFTKCLGREDSLLGESAIIGCSITKNLNEGELEQELREDLLEEGSRKEGLWIESINKDEVVKAASSGEGDFWSKISNRDDLADTSVSQDNNSLTNNSCKESLFDSQKQKGDADLVLDQNNRSFLLESRGPSSKSSYMKISTEEKEATETEDHTDNELSSLLEFFSHGC